MFGVTLAGKAKASALAAQATETLPAATADVDCKDEASPATAIQPPSDQENQANVQSNSESLSLDTAQPSAATQVSTQKSSNGMSTSQSSPLHPHDPDDSPSASSDNMKASRSQSPVPNVSQPPQAASDSPVQPALALRSPVPSSPASSLTHSPRPRSAASEADSVPEASPVLAQSASSSPSSRAPSPSLHNRASHSPATQQAFSQQLRSALSPAGSLQGQSHHDPSPQQQATYTPPATPRGQQAEPSAATRSSAGSPVRQDPPAGSHYSSAVQSASPSRPSSANSLQPASVMADMTNAMPRSSPASPGPPRSGLASPRQADQGAHAHAASTTQAGDRRAATAAAAAAAAALTGPPKANAGGAHAPLPRPASTAPSYHALAPPARSVSAFEQAAAALPPLAAAAFPAGKGKPPSSSDNRPASADAYTAASAQGQTAAPTLAPGTAPVGKPPGLPSPVPATQDQGSADLDSVISSDRWPDQVSAKSETSSNPRSPKKEIKVPAVMAPAPPPTAPPTAPAPPASENMSDMVSQDGSSGGDRHSDTSNQSQDQSKAAIAARLEKEREQQRKQEAKHLLAKERAAARRQQEIAEQDRRQQEDHARKAQLKANQLLADKTGTTAPGLHGAAPYKAAPAGFREPFRGGKGFDETAPRQAPKAYPAAGVRHVPAPPGPHGGRPPAYPEPDYNSDYGSDYGGSEHEHAYGRGQGSGRGPVMDRGGKARGAGRGSGRGFGPGTYAVKVAICGTWLLLPRSVLNMSQTTTSEQIFAYSLRTGLLVVWILHVPPSMCQHSTRRFSACYCSRSLHAARTFRQQTLAAFIL